MIAASSASGTGSGRKRRMARVVVRPSRSPTLSGGSCTPRRYFSERFDDLFGLLDQAADLRRTEPAMTAQRSDRRELARAGPAADGLGVDPEEHGHLGRRQEGIGSFAVGCHWFAFLSGCLLTIGERAMELDSP